MTKFRKYRWVFAGLALQIVLMVGNVFIQTRNEKLRRDALELLDQASAVYARSCNYLNVSD